MTTAAVLMALLLFGQQGSTPAPNSVEADVEQLVRAARTLTGVWPSQAPPPIREVALVVRHGTRATPALVALMSDDANAEGDRQRWKVPQQAALALCRIYSQTSHCGRAYCDGDPPERIANVKSGWLRVIAEDAGRRALSADEMLAQFQREKVFWRQMEIGRALAAKGDRGVIAALEPRLDDEDRHLRGNAAFVINRLGDRRGFDVIAGILADRSPRPPGQGSPGGNWTAQVQIRADRYYAAHLLGDLRDPRGVDLLVALLQDKDVESIVPWALAEIGDARAIPPLIAALQRDDPSARVLTIAALETLNARDALPRLREMLEDTRRANFAGQTSVAEAARRAIAAIQ